MGSHFLGSPPHHPSVYLREILMLLTSKFIVWENLFMCLCIEKLHETSFSSAPSMQIRSTLLFKIYPDARAEIFRHVLYIGWVNNFGLWKGVRVKRKCYKFPLGYIYSWLSALFLEYVSTSDTAPKDAKGKGLAYSWGYFMLTIKWNLQRRIINWI